MNSGAFGPWARRILPVVLVGGLLALVYLVLVPFFAPIAWAGILSYVTWPIFLRLRDCMGGRGSVSALLAVGCMAIALVLPLLWLIVLIEEELVAAYNAIAAYLNQGPGPLPDFVARIPWIGSLLQDWIDAHLADPAGIKQHLVAWLTQGSSRLFHVFGGIGRNAAKLSVALFTLFFFYRDGETLLHQVRSVLQSLVGRRIDSYLAAAGDMSRAIVFSVIVAALLQGIVAALGYRAVGVETPVLLGVATAFASVIPIFGTVLVWGPISIGLLLSGYPWQAIGLVAWGVFLINPTDNLIRPLLISNATRISVLFIMFGVLGGLAAFGLIGLFLGPVILAVAIAVWSEWVKSISAMPDPAGGKNDDQSPVRPRSP